MNKYRYPRVPNRRKRRFHFALTWIATGWRGANETPDISRFEYKVNNFREAGNSPSLACHSHGRNKSVRWLLP
ncbi:uncharacterized protein LOC143207993 isoform X3 [Lasioglossum baleicum]|uniref:uncharacterized protein LOC143207993 isoform X3 n=1 Tax=Lasioglossum baleicum TaxID=434251 RepID=UPI003FCD4413